MHKIDTDGSVAGQFSDGDAAHDINGTLVDAAWLNDIQENLIAVLEATGIVPVKGRASDLLDAIDGLISKNAGPTLADIAELQALTGATYMVVKVTNTSGQVDYWWRDPYDHTTVDDGSTVIVDADGNRWRRQIGASWIAYEDGSTIQSLKPAQLGADVTGDHTAANTLLVGSTAAAVIEAGSAVGNQLSQALIDAGLSQTVADLVTTTNATAEGVSIGATNVNDWNGIYTPSDRSVALRLRIDKANKKVTVGVKGFNGHSGTAFFALSLEVQGNTFASYSNVDAFNALTYVSAIDLTTDANKWSDQALIWNDTVSGTGSASFDMYVTDPITTTVTFRIRVSRLETSDTNAITYITCGDTGLLTQAVPPVRLYLSPLDNTDKDVLIMVNAPTDAGATNRKTFSQTTPPALVADDLHVGDFWIDTTDGKNVLYRWDGSAWVDQRDFGASAGEGLVTSDPAYVLDPTSLNGVDIGSATVTSGIVKTINQIVSGLDLLGNNSGFEEGSDGDVGVPIYWFREGMYATSRTQTYADVPPDSQFGSANSYGAASATQNGGSVGWWRVGKRFEVSTTGKTLNVSARAKLSSGTIPATITAASTQTFIAANDSYIMLRFFRADETLISVPATTAYSRSATHQYGIAGAFADKWFTISHSCTVPAETYRIEVLIVATAGTDAVESLGYIGNGDAIVKLDDVLVSYAGVISDVTEATYAKDPGATYGATYGQTLSGAQPAEDFADTKTLWIDAAGPGVKVDGTDTRKTYYSPTPPASAKSDDAWFDVDGENSVYRSDGTSWVAVDQSLRTSLDALASGFTVYFSSTSPTGSAGDRWIEPDGTTYVYTTSWGLAPGDILGGLVSNIAGSPTSTSVAVYAQSSAPAGSAGDVWWDTSSKRLMTKGASTWSLSIVQASPDVVDPAVSAGDAVSGALVATGTTAGSRTILSTSTPTDLGDLSIGDVWWKMSDGTAWSWDGATFVSGASTVGVDLASSLTAAGVSSNLSSSVSSAIVSSTRSTVSVDTISSWPTVYAGGGYRGVFLQVSVDDDPLSGTYKTVTLGLSGKNGHIGTASVSFELEMLSGETITSFSQGSFSGTITNVGAGITFGTDINAWGPNGVALTQTIVDAVDHSCSFVMSAAPSASTVLRLKVVSLSTTDSHGHAHLTLGGSMVSIGPAAATTILINFDASGNAMVMTPGATSVLAAHGRTYVQGTDPAVDPSASLQVGYIWVDDVASATYRRTASGWVAYRDPTTAEADQYRSSLAASGVSQSVIDVSDLASRSSVEMWQRSSVDVATWSAAYASTTREHVLSVWIVSDTLHVSLSGHGSAVGTASADVSIEVYGSSFASYSQGTSTAALTAIPHGVDFSADGWGQNGFRWADSVTDTGTVESTFQLSAVPGATTVFRMLVDSLVTTDGSGRTSITLGDSRIVSSPASQVELYFCVSAAAEDDAIVTVEAPGVFGAATAGSAVLKKNYDSFTTVNSGEAYICGFDSSGAIADVPGFVVYNGQKIYLDTNRVIRTGSTGAGYIYFDTTKAGRFTVNGSNADVVFATKTGGSWFYDDNSTTLVQFTPVAGDIVIGTMEVSNDLVLDANIWSHGIPYTVVSDPAATNSKTFAQTTAPASGMAAGDFWIDTDDGNKLYRYDGSSWVAMQDAGAAVGTELQSALVAAGVGSVIADFVSMTVNSSETPSAVINVVDWSVYAVPSVTSHLLHILIDKPTKTVQITYAGIASPASAVAIHLELEVIGNTVASFNPDTFSSTYSYNASPIAFPYDGTLEWGSNGIKVDETTTSTLKKAQLVLTNTPDATNLFRLRIASWPYAQGYVIFGDTPVAANPTIPTEMYFSPMDGSDYDVLVMKNAPAEAGADVTATNTSADTAAVNGTPATTVSTSSGTTYRSSMETNDPTVTTVGGSTAATVTTAGNYYSGTQSTGVTASAASSQVTNLLLWSNDLSKASYIASNATVTGGFSDPFGGTTAQLVADSATTSQHYIYQAVTKAASAIQYTCNAIVKNGGNNSIMLWVGDSTTNNAQVIVTDLTTGTIATATASGFTSPSASIYSLGSGWFMVSLTFTTNTDTVVRPQIVGYNGTTTTYLGTGTGVYFAGLDLIAGSNPGRHVQTTTASATAYGTDAAGSYVKIAVPEITTAGFSGKRVKVSFFAKQPTAGSSAVGCRYSYGAGLGTSWNVFTTNTSWQQFTFTFDVPVTETARTDELHFTSCSSSLQVLVDSVYVEPIVKPAEIDGTSLLNADQLISSVELSINEVTSTTTIFSTGADTDTWTDLLSATVTTTGTDLVVISGLSDLYVDQITDDSYTSPYTKIFQTSTGVTLGSNWTVSGGALNHSSGSTATATVTITGLTPGKHYVVYASSSGGQSSYYATASFSANETTSSTSPSAVPYMTLYDYAYQTNANTTPFMALSSSVTMTLTPSNSALVLEIDKVWVREWQLGLVTTQYVTQTAAGPGGPQIYWRVLRNGSTVVYTSEAVIVSGAGSAPSIFFNTVDTAAVAGSATYTIQLKWVKGSYTAGSLVSWDGNYGAKATQTLTFSGQPANGETVTIGTKVYTFQTTLTNVDGNVLIGASTAASVTNLINAINLGTGSGSTYAAATTVHPCVSAANGTTTTMVVTSKFYGSVSIATTETIANASWGAATTSGGQIMGTGIVKGTGTYWSAYVGFGWMIYDGSNNLIGIVTSVDDNKTITYDPTTSPAAAAEYEGTASYTASNPNHKLVLRRGRSFLEVTEYRN